MSLCFVEGTLVHTQDGLKPIEDINVGDLVVSKNDITGENDWKRVSQLFINYGKTVFDVTVTTDDGQQEVLGATHEHPFWAEGKGWVKAGELVAGDRVHLRDGQLASISSVKTREGQHTTYNFEVEDFHTYFVGERGVWVHNACVDDVGEFLYRGVHSKHPALGSAKKGDVVPGNINGNATADMHNAGGHAANSPFTSWTRDPDIAVRHANKHGSGGVVLRVPQGAPPSGAKWNWEWSPDIWGEQEVLMRGVRSGVEVLK
ncbi:polymorphic toxin-type HINT domain-containing protein [Agarilytica rhodophyticola]|uniref:polymorphic toxin-type HINT domain-containing protein n=1 Tax=Agarilytica rhodophyticola TaxID=1737490 RepID=UPI000B344273|nr:polymorphic toxin-type HINT domain-containing protein [Agarilytica rhodophyticola]